MIVVIPLLLFSLAYPFAAVGNEYYPNHSVEKKMDVVVEGMVYCSPCKNYDGSWSLSGAQPIPAAKMIVICKNHKDRVSYYKVYETDANGHFYAELKEFKLGDNLLDHPLHSCRVKLVSSPLEDCNLQYNINKGAPFYYKNKRVRGRNYEAVVYTAGPLAFHPTHCPTATVP